MQKPKVTKALVGAVTAGACIVFFATAARALIVSAEPEANVSPAAAALGTKNSASSEAPVHITIPVIGVDANVGSVGLGKTGNMAVPTNYTDVGWYRYGTLPGEIGSAVMDGHLDNGFGLDAVFKRLGELTPKDDIYITTAGGKKLHFRVISVDTYPYDALPLHEIFHRNDGSYLNLITCDGTWSLSVGQYNERLVVRSALVAS